MERILSLTLLLFVASAATADGVNNTLADPPVRPIIRPVIQAPVVIGPPLTIGPGAGSASGAASGSGFGNNIAWDHILVGGAILGVMYLFGESESAASSF